MIISNIRKTKSHSKPLGQKQQQQQKKNPDDSNKAPADSARAPPHSPSFSRPNRLCFPTILGSNRPGLCWSFVLGRTVPRKHQFKCRKNLFLFVLKPLVPTCPKWLAICCYRKREVSAPPSEDWERARVGRRWWCLPRCETHRVALETWKLIPPGWESRTPIGYHRASLIMTIDLV